MKRTVLNLLDSAIEKYGDLCYTLEKGDNDWVGLKYPEVKEQAQYLACAFLDLDLKNEDKIAILSEGRNNWIVGEYATLMTRCVTVPLSVKLLDEELHFRLNHSDSKAILLSYNNFDKIASVWDKIETEDFKIIYLDNELSKIQEQCDKAGIKPGKDLFLFDDLIESGKKLYKENSKKLDEIISSIEEYDVVTISYTSGTTGNPKGIMLTHLNYYSNSSDAMEFFNVVEKDRLFIVLPIDHSFAHTVGIYASLVRGLAIFFLDSRGGAVAALKNIPVNMKEANPHFMLTVPALTGNLMQKIKDGIYKKGGIAKTLFDAGMKASEKIHGDGYNKGGFVSKLTNGIQYKLADKLVFSKVREIFGENMRYCVGGGALLDIKQQKFFYAIGIPVYQGYGLSEASPIISANTPAIHKLGTSGKVIPGVTCKIIRTDGTEATKGEKGEIVIKGNNVMKGYYKNPDASKDALRGEWLYTGDLGYIDEDDFLMVIGREKALLISHDGEKYSPEEIEEAICNCSDLVQQAMVYNDHKKYTSAVITINIEKTKAVIESQNIIKPEDLINLIKESFDAYKSDKEFKGKFPIQWTPSTFQIVEEPFSEQNKMINSTMKMVRYKITEAYIEKINFMYTPEGSKAINKHNVQAIKNLFSL